MRGVGGAMNHFTNLSRSQFILNIPKFDIR